jgi:hypothetical protein
MDNPYVAPATLSEPETPPTGEPAQRRAGIMMIVVGAADLIIAAVLASVLDRSPVWLLMPLVYAGLGASLLVGRPHWRWLALVWIAGRDGWGLRSKVEGIWTYWSQLSSGGGLEPILSSGIAVVVSVALGPFPFLLLLLGKPGPTKRNVATVLLLIGAFLDIASILFEVYVVPRLRG